jgi:hypothetical protein
MAGPVTTGVCANIHPEMATAAKVNNNFFIVFFFNLVFKYPKRFFLLSWF